MNNLLNSNEKNIKKALLWGVPIIFILGSLFHSLYAVTGDNIISKIVFPTNESVFSHLKLSCFPVLLYFLVSYLVLHDYDDIKGRKWTICASVSVLVSILIIVSGFYIATAGFDIHSLILDIAIYFVSVLLGQLLAVHVYKHSNGSKLELALAIIFLIVLLVMFYLFTVNPPNLPIFNV